METVNNQIQYFLLSVEERHGNHVFQINGLLTLLPYEQLNRKIDYLLKEWHERPDDDETSDENVGYSGTDISESEIGAYTFYLGEIHVSFKKCKKISPDLFATLTDMGMFRQLRAVYLLPE